MATNLPKYQATRKDDTDDASSSRRGPTSYDQSRLGSQSRRDQGNLAGDKEEATAKTLPEKSTDGGAFDWRKTGAIPKRGAGGDQSRASLTAEAEVSPREVNDQSHVHVDEAGDSQANSDATRNARPTDHPISTAQLPTSESNPYASKSYSSAIYKTLVDSGNSQISRDDPTVHWLKRRDSRRSYIEGEKDEIVNFRGPGKHSVVYGGAAEVIALAEDIRKRQTTCAVLEDGSQDGVLMCKKFTIRGGHYRNGYEYSQGKLLGTGAHSKVFAIRDNKSPAVAAGKFVTLKHFVADEAIIWCPLIHENIVRLFGLIQTGIMVMFLSEYDPGNQTLQTRVDQCVAFGQGEALEVTEQLLEALAFLHQKNIIHRDVYPSNILVKSCQSNQKYGGNVKLLDFGIAVKLKCPETAGYIEETTDGMGNDTYRAPEIERGESYDGRVDVWSASCTLMCLLKGSAPWCGIIIKDYPLVDIPNSTDPIVRDLVERAHKVDKNSRPRAQEVLQRCKDIPREKVKEMYSIRARPAKPLIDSSPAKLGNSNESPWSDDSSDGHPVDPQQAAPVHDDIGAGDARPHGPDGPVRPVRGPPADPQLDDETLTHNQPAPVHDDIGAGDARPHGPDGPVRPVPGPPTDPQLDEETLTHNQPAPVHDDIGAADVRPHGVKGIFVTVKDEGCEDMKIKLPPGLNSVICVAEALYEEIKTKPFTLHEMNGGALGRGHTFRIGNHTLVAMPAPDGGDWPWRMHANGKVEYA
ncbi:mitogen-activated protein kinase kinase kinase 14-like [Patiria miniata]|uniref:Protein kinase domain-containing protein n=1 Tax=Patiria miniata TaxID=46514 RepID=A0A913ZEL8_PATMI|nr:mitogen-activated protein kinase kinase kinase 14-like [Patiria miniata]XP_038049397.1 mitogen-activated protein kinase kinase kinase 14-like [Patiria miniata]